jgi:hypothetical protein
MIHKLIGMLHEYDVPLMNYAMFYVTSHNGFFQMDITIML